MKILLFLLSQFLLFFVYAESSTKDDLNCKEKHSEQTIILKKYEDPEFQFKKFLKDSSNSNFSEIKHVSKVIMSKGSSILKISFVNLLHKYKDKYVFCAFELGKILLHDAQFKTNKRNLYSDKFNRFLLYSGQLQTGQKTGLKIIEECAEKKSGEAVDFLIEYYSNTSNRKKEFYYLEKAAANGNVHEKFVYYCIEKKLFNAARKYFALYIQGLKDKIHDIENGKAEIIDKNDKGDYYIQIIKQKIKKDESFFLDTIRKAEKENNFINVQLKLHELSELYDFVPNYEVF
jgi:hypothetical protein